MGTFYGTWWLTKIGIYHIMVITTKGGSKMKIITVKDDLAGGKVAFEILSEKLAAGAKTLGLATGGTPLTLYHEIVNSDLDFSDVTSINLDEYVGLPA